MKTFKSKVGHEILVPVLAVLLTTALLPIINGAPLSAVLTMQAIIVPTTAFILYLFYNTSYSITEHRQPLILCGFMYKKKVDILDIKFIRRTGSILSAPATSADRIEIKYGKWNSVIISPKDKQSFADELLKINPNIDIDLN